MARGINRGYIDGKMTAYLNWPIIAAITPNLPWPTMGVALAPQPWSGYYSIGKNAWVMAQTTQFTQPGWHYLDSSSGYIGGNRNNGSYVTLKSTNNSDYSTVIETQDASSAQTLNFNVTGGLSTGAVHVWSTNVRSNSSSDYFVHASDITPSGGAYSLTVQPGYVYTITTTTGQGKGTATSPAQKGFALPYSDNFDANATGTEAKYLEDWQGSFEVAACGGGRTGQCVRQMSAQAPITWDNLSDPHAMIGDVGWSNYTVTSDVLLEKSGYAELLGRANTQTYGNNGASGLNAYHLRVSDSGAWSILSSNTSNNTNFTTLASGNVAALGTNRWHTLAPGLLRQHHHRRNRRQDGRHRRTTPAGAPARPATPPARVRPRSSTTCRSRPAAAATGGGSGAIVGGGRGPVRGRDPGASQTTAARRTELWDCNGGANQRGPPPPPANCGTCGQRSAWTPTGRAPPTAPRSTSGPATAAPTSSGTSTPTARSPARSPASAWTRPVRAPPTAPWSNCGPATEAATSNGRTAERLNG